MENYCRLCAEQKDSNKLLRLDSNNKHYSDIIGKLAFLNNILANLHKNQRCLPNSVCIVCQESLNQTYDFISKVQKAQEILSDIFCHYEKHEYSDTEAFDDNEIVKYEKEKNDAPHCIEPKHNVECVIKEEISNSKSDEATDTEFKSVVQILNVQNIFGIGPNESDLSLYAHEVKDINLKNNESWNNYNWMCNICNLMFSDISTLRSHSKIVHFKCATFKCSDCKKYGEDVEFQSFISHVRKHRRNLRKCCYYCNLCFSKTNKLEKHIKMHMSGSKLACTLCGEILESQKDMMEHLVLYSSLKPKRKPRRKKGEPLTPEDLTCPLCKKLYKTPNSLRDHMKLHKSNRKRDYTCDRCGKAFYNKGTLTSHIMSHDQNRPHTCKICNKSFMFPNMLRRHVEMHSGVKPYSCEECGRCFRLQYQLKAHRIIHTDKMPFACQYCSKTFRFKQILKNHEHQHTGAKPYSCNECGMQFTNWSNYNKHMKRRHNMDTSKKKITPEGVFPVNPETGQMMQLVDENTEKWKSQIMVPCKRGKRKGA